MIKRIVDAACIDNTEAVIEIGPGLGVMTGELALKAGKVVAIEIDKRLIPVLSEELKEFKNVDIINRDIMKLDIKKDVIENLNNNLSGIRYKSIKVVANLPYYITTPIIMKLLEEKPGIDAMVFMVQREVAERITAKPGGKEYGSLSVAVQYYSAPEKILDIGPQFFIPQPAVHSTLIKLNIYKTAPVELDSEDVFFKVVKAAFGQRRKNIVNALFNSGYFMKQKNDIKEILIKQGISPDQRGETLTIMQFAQLANSFSI